MSDDDFIKPKLGKSRTLGAGRGKRHLGRVLAAVNRAGGLGRKQSGFTGKKFARGGVVAASLKTRDRFAAYRQRRVIVKARLCKLAGKGFGAARAHLSYIQRDGVTREGERGELFAAENDIENGKEFLTRCEGDRHQFRFIVSPEDGHQYEDLKPFVRRLMEQMEQDLDTRLDWVAVNHYNTGHPHAHIILRGKDERNKDLVISPAYIKSGIRERAAELVRLDLGPRLDAEIETTLHREMDQERLTSIDRSLLRECNEDRTLIPRHSDPFQHTIRQGRLKKLERLGLATELRPGTWHFHPDMEDSLRTMGERGDIIRTMQREMTARGLNRSPGDTVIHELTTEPGQPIIGRVVARGLSDEHQDRHYLIVDGVDGRTHYVDLGRGEATGPTPEGIVVEVIGKSAEPRKVDRTVLEIATANGGRYSEDIHLKHDRRASYEYAQTHIRRLETIRRLTHAVERELDGSWIITPDHLDKAVAYETAVKKLEPVTVRTLSTIPLDQQPAFDGQTWIDQELASDNRLPLRDSGFGREVREAQRLRRQWLIGQDLAQIGQGRVTYRTDMLRVLRKRELDRAAKSLTHQHGLRYLEARPGQRVEGTIIRTLDLACGKVAVIELASTTDGGKARDFTLVPWRPVLERNIGKQVSGVIRDVGEINWTLGRKRGLGLGM